MKTIGILNQKGGYGKPTITANLAAEACGDGKRVLMIDGDQQGSTMSLHAIQ